MTCFQLIQVIDNWFSVRNMGNTKVVARSVTNDDIQNTTERKREN